MIEAIVISSIVGFAALHVAFRLLPKLAQRKICDVIVVELNKLGLHAMTQRLLATSPVADKACGSGCDGCGAQTVGGDELKLNGSAQVMRFYPRLK
jgi:hypothetical protein